MTNTHVIFTICQAIFQEYFLISVIFTAIWEIELFNPIQLKIIQAPRIKIICPSSHG